MSSENNCPWCKLPVIGDVYLSAKVCRYCAHVYIRITPRTKDNEYPAASTVDDEHISRVIAASTQKRLAEDMGGLRGVES